MPPRSLKGIYVTADDPRFMEREIKPADEVLDLERLDVKQLRAAYIERQRNFSTAPFDPDGRSLRFFPGGFTIWSGHPGAGKTTLLRQLACHLIHRGMGVFVCSLEEQTFDVFLRHACVALGTENPSEDGLQWCSDLWSEKLKLWNFKPGLQDARHQQILAALRVLARDHGVRHAIIDSLMCLDVQSNDWEGQRLFAGSLAATCQLAGCHVHLVAHPRKPSQGGQEPDLADVAGSADLSRKADNVLFVQRARNETQSSTSDATPMAVAIRKQRFGTGRICELSGWFHHRHRQFVFDQFQQEPTRYLAEAAYERRIATEPLF